VKTTCPRCHGQCYFVPGDAKSACGRCDGEGIIGYKRCHNSLATDYWVREFEQAYLLAAEYGLWPEPGGAQDQVCSFYAGFVTMTNERNRIAKDQAEAPPPQSPQ